ncbi:MAG TPA: ACT domain-containing protein [Phycisphaerae bacterium]|nr:ACT domain-containing protein [Phycisphaerae bacterium]
MESMIQFSVFLVNKPGVLSQVCRELGKAKVNIIALAMMDAVEHGVLRVICADPDQARPVLRKLNIPLTETEVLAVTLANRPGAVADVCERLSASHIRVSYVYCTTGVRGGKTVAVFKVPDIKKATKVIEGRKTTTRDMKVKLRRSKVKTTPPRRVLVRR